MSNFSLGDAQLTTSVDLTGINKGMAEAESVATSKGAGTGKAFGVAMTAAIAAAGIAVAAAVGAGLAEAVKRAAGFEQAMANVGAISLASAADMEKLTAAALEAGSTTKFTAVEAADALSFLAMAGFSAADSVDALPGVLALAAATGTDLATSADIASNILSAFGMEASQTGHLVDVMAATASRANTNVPQLGEAMKYAGPIAAAMGMSVEDAATAIAKMSDAGIQGSQAGTALRGILTRLAAPTGEAAKVMAELGINVFDANGKMLPLPEIVGAVAGGMTGLTDAQRTAALQTLVGTEAMSGFLALMSVGEEDLAAFSLGLEEAGGTAQDMADRQLATLSGQMTLLGSAVDGVFIKVGSLLIPILTTLVQSAVIPAVEALGQWIDKITAAGGPLDQLSAIISNVVAVIVAQFTGQGTTSVQSWANAFSIAQSMISTYITAVQQIVTTIVSALAAFWQRNGDQIQAWTNTTWNTIGRIVNLAMNLIQSIVVPLWTAISSFISNNQDTIVAVLTMAWNNISTIISTVLAVIESVITIALAAIQGDWETVWETIKTLTNTVIEAVKTIITNTLTGIRDTMLGLLNSMKDNTSTVWNAIEAVITTVINVIEGIINTVLSVIQGDWEGAWNTMQGVATTVTDTIKSVVITTFETMRETVSGIFTTLKENATEKFNEILDSISGLAGRAADAGRSFINSIRDGVMSAISSLINEAKAALAQLADLLPGSEPKDPTSPLRGLADRGRAIVENMLPGMDAGFNEMDAVMRDGLAGAADISATRTEYNLTAQYGYQPERRLADDVRMLQLLGDA